MCLSRFMMAVGETSEWREVKEGEEEGGVDAGRR